MFSVLTDCEGMSLDFIKLKYNYDEAINEYVDFLLENEFIFFSDEPSLFPKINTDFFYPFDISNTIINFNNSYNIKIVLEQLNLLKCKNIEIRFLKAINLKHIEDILLFLTEIDSIICHIGLYFECEEVLNDDTLLKLFDNPRITFIVLINSKTKKELKTINLPNGRFFHYSDQESLDKKNCGIVDKLYFITNTNSYTESLNHNSCLNKKLSIDKDGNIKNCPSMPQSFGNIKDTTLEAALNHPDFKKYWNVNKDMIAVCKDCEFRHICTDCRAYTERTHFDGEIDLSKPLKCGYNPYTNEWVEWSTNPLKEKAIEYYGMQELVKKDA